MTQIELNIKGVSKRYTLPATLGEMPISRYLAWQEAVGGAENPSPRQTAIALAAILGAEVEDVRQADAKDVLQVLRYCEAYVQETEPQAQEVDGFQFGGVYYTYPLTPINAISLDAEPLKGSTFEQWEDAQNLIHDFHNADEHTGRVKAMPWVMAVYCLPKGASRHDETQDTLAERGRAFQELPLQTVWDFAFFLARQNPIWIRGLASLSRSLARKVKSQIDEWKSTAGERAESI